MATYGGSGVGTDGKGSSTSAVDIVVDEVHMMMDEWLGRPSVGRRPDYSSRKSTEKTGEG